MSVCPRDLQLLEERTDLSLEQAVLAATGTVLGSILSGASAYGSATNVSLGASRLELSARQPPGHVGDRDGAERDDLG